MKAIYLDCFSGVSGNMLLGAFLEAGVSKDYIVGELNKLPMAGEFAFHQSMVEKCGIHAAYVDIELADGAESTHGHSHDHGHVHMPHVHRSMADIRNIIRESEIPEGAKEKAIKIFEVLAKAEGKVHDRPADEVHFHEVGAVDSIVDIVGTALALDYLGIEKVFASDVNTGTGTVTCAHGIMPVPAPATAELLLGWRTYHLGVKKELTTPTGAAVLAALAEYSESLPRGFVTERIAYGAGSWDLETPNVVRLYLGDQQAIGTSSLCILEANIDDMSPQIFGYLYERLLDEGALDVWSTPIYMKKNRPSAMLSVLVNETHREQLTDLIFQESTSIGLRVMPVAERLEAKRCIEVTKTKYGEVHLKISAWNGHIVSVSAEYEDCKKLAQKNGVPLKAVQHEALQEIYRCYGGY